LNWHPGRIGKVGAGINNGHKVFALVMVKPNWLECSPISVTLGCIKGTESPALQERRQRLHSIRMFRQVINGGVVRAVEDIWIGSWGVSLEINARQAGAIPECAATNTRDTGRYGNGGQVGAGIKRSFSNS